MKKWPILALIVTVVAAVWIIRSTREEPVRVRVGRATRTDIENTVGTAGTVVPVHEFLARSSFSGIIEKIYVKLGQRVEPGQLLVSIKDPFAHSRIDSAYAALQSAKVGNENLQNNGSKEDRINFAGDEKRTELDEADATRSLAALKDLHSKGDATTSEVTAAEQRLANIQASLQTLRQRMTARYSADDRASGKARLDEALATLAAEKQNFTNVEVTSPIAGTVYLIPVTQFDFAPGGAELMRIADLQNMEVHANFDEPDIGKLHVGQAVRVEWEGRPGYAWHGHILHAPIAVITDGQRRVGECIITLDDTRELLPVHTTVTVKVTLQRREGVLSIPREALHPDGKAFFVYKVVHDTLERTPVDVGIISLSRVEITKGLEEKDVVALVATGNRDLSDHLKVEPID